MSVNPKQLRAAVQELNWEQLFRSVLKWTKPTDKVRSETIDGERFTLTPIADTGGMQVYVVHAASGLLPGRPTRNKLEIRLRRTQVEHILIFEDGAKERALLQWVKRGQQGRRSREFAYQRGESGEALIQKLQGIAFQIDDFDARGQIEITKVTARVEKNLDVEQVTKKFYSEFERQRSAFQQFLRGIPIESEQRWYVSVMLNRLMFIYFIQAKGFLNKNPDYLRERLAWSQAQLGADRYYAEFLRVLFFQGFALEPGQRSAEVHQKLGTIPYLNGGLFLPHPIEERYGEAITIPDSAFEQLFAFFGGWRWHLSERPGSSDREIDPDVLGYIFEKYINQKQMGAYYTRDDITGYICRNTIIPALFDKAGLSLAPLNLAQRISDYIYPALKQEQPLPTESERELAARRARVASLIADGAAGRIATINDAVTANLDLEGMIEDLIPKLDAPKVYSLYTALAGDPHAGKLPLSVLDPTVGSGAFLFATLRILKPIYATLLDRMEELLEAKQAAALPLRTLLDAAEEHANRDYFITKSIVVRNLYGVDLMAEATEICKLRLFLRMVADLDEARQIEPLPDIDFNIRAGNALVGYARPDEIGLIYRDSVVSLSPRQQKLLDDIRSVQRELSVYRNAQLQFSPSAAEGRTVRQAIRARLDTINAGLDTNLLKIGQIQQEPDGSFNTQPFHWFTAFYEILDGGGFDVIVGNPPYVEYSKVRGQRKQDGEDRYTIYGYKTESCGNLYAFVMERCLNLTHDQSYIGLIVPISVICTDRTSTLQSLIKKTGTTWYASFDTIPGRLFGKEVEQRLSTVIHVKDQIKNTYTTSFRRFLPDQRNYLFQTVFYGNVDRFFKIGFIPRVDPVHGQNIILKIQRHSESIEKYFDTLNNNPVYIHRIIGYYTKAFDFIPFFRNDRDGEKKSEDYKLFYIKQDYRKEFLSLANSGLFYWFWHSHGDGFHCGYRDVFSFPDPFAHMSMNTRQKLRDLATTLMIDLKKHSEIKIRIFKVTGRADLQEFDVAKSKPIIDEIDRVLAAHYGFTDEELDFIINYDIKYRMGRGEADAEGE